MACEQPVTPTDGVDLGGNKAYGLSAFFGLVASKWSLDFIAYPWELTLTL
jgi:hypothetical protein